MNAQGRQLSWLVPCLAALLLGSLACGHTGWLGRPSVRLTYRVQGSVSEAQVLYRTMDGHEGERIEFLPWQTELGTLPGEEAYLYVRNPGVAGTVTCSLLLNGKPWLSKTCEGNHCVAICKGRVP